MTMNGRTSSALGSFLFCALVLVSIAVDASLRRAESAKSSHAVLVVAARLPSSDLAMSGGARWLRSPSLAEPSAAFDLGPAMLDPDPAGGLLDPPREEWKTETLRTPRGVFPSP